MTDTQTPSLGEKLGNALGKFTSKGNSETTQDTHPREILTNGILKPTKDSDSQDKTASADEPDSDKLSAKEKLNKRLDKINTDKSEINVDRLQNNPDKFGTPGEPFSSNNQLRFGMIVATGALFAWFFWHRMESLADICLWMATAFFIALGLDPLVSSLMRKGWPRWAGVLTVTVATLAIFAIFVANLVPTIIEQVSSLVKNLPTYITNMMNTEWFHHLDQKFGIRQVVEENAHKAVESIGSSMGNITNFLVGAGSAVSGGLFALFMVTILTIYFLASMPEIKSFIYRCVPASRRQRFQPLSEEIIRGVSGFINGQTVVCIINACVAGTILYFLGVPYIVLLMFLDAFLAFIPLVGATISLVFIGLVASTVSVQAAIIWLITYMIYLQIESYVLSPTIMKKTVEVPPVVTIVAIMIGSALFGILGAIMAIPVAAAVILIFREVIVPRQDQL